MADEQQAGNSETDNDAESSNEGFVSRMTSYYVGMGSPNVPFPYVHYIPDGQEHDDDNKTYPMILLARVTILQRKVI